jgi:hypothetical protein
MERYLKAADWVDWVIFSLWVVESVGVVNHSVVLRVSANEPSLSSEQVYRNCPKVGKTSGSLLLVSVALIDRRGSTSNLLYHLKSRLSVSNLNITRIKSVFNVNTWIHVKCVCIYIRFNTFSFNNFKSFYFFEVKKMWIYTSTPLYVFMA